MFAVFLERCWVSQDYRVVIKETRGGERGRENAGASYKEPFTHETCSYIDIKPLRCVMNIEARFYEVTKGARAVSRADKIARSIVIKLDQKLDRKFRTLLWTFHAKVNFVIILPILSMNRVSISNNTWTSNGIIILAILQMQYYYT